MITVRDLVFDYPTARALHGVSFAIEPGTITALVGPNGAGKTTLLRCLAALETPFSGAITIDGLDVLAEPRERERVRDECLHSPQRPFGGLEMVVVVCSLLADVLDTGFRHHQRVSKVVRDDRRELLEAFVLPFEVLALARQFRDVGQEEDGAGAAVRADGELSLPEPAFLAVDAESDGRGRLRGQHGARQHLGGGPAEHVARRAEHGLDPL